MRWLKAWLGVVAVILLSAGSASGQATTGTITGRVVDAQGRAVPGVTVIASSPNLQGTRMAVTGEPGRLHLRAAAAGHVYGELRAQRLRSSGTVGRPRPHPGLSAGHRAGSGGHRRVRGRRGNGVGAGANRPGGDRSQSGPDRHAADQSRHQCGAPARAFGACDRAQRQLFDLRRHDVRESLSAQWRHDQREPAGTAARPLRRGRDPGDDCRLGRRVGRVRPLRRRRRQRDHEVRREPLQRIASRHAQQRHLARS